MLPHHRSHQAYNLRAKPERQQGQDQEAYKSSGDDRRQEVAEAHLEYGRSKHKKFKRHGRRQHARKHESPEFMLFKRAVNSLKAFFRDSLAKNFLAAYISNDVKRDAAQR